jgi:hypothetical protein
MLLLKQLARLITRSNWGKLHPVELVHELDIKSDLVSSIFAHLILTKSHPSFTIRTVIRSS